MLCYSNHLLESEQSIDEARWHILPMTCLALGRSWVGAGQTDRNTGPAGSGAPLESNLNVPFDDSSLPSTPSGMVDPGSDLILPRHTDFFPSRQSRSTVSVVRFAGGTWPHLPPSRTVLLVL